MPNWKKALVIGSLSAGALLFLRGRRPAGVAVVGIGLGVLAVEHPEKFQRVWEEGPEYLYRGTELFAALTRIVERLADETRFGAHSA
jgi:hypothetical protein